MPEANDELRPALYYPYIHIRSERWLKATLLCMPSVKRIVPQEYAPEDEPTIEAYTHIAGPNGALLQSVPSYTPAAEDAEHRLLHNLQQHANTINKRYDRTRAPAVDEYWIHKAKFIDALLDYLRKHHLAWPSVDGHAVGHRTWCALHPTLGKAIMTTLCLSIARDQRYDIVTADGEYHEALLATKEDAIFETLLHDPTNERSTTRGQTRQELGQLVITMSGVNFNALLPESIPELQASPHFHGFQRLLRTSASTIDQDADYREYKRQIRQEADQIITAWQQTKQDVSKDLREALFEGVALGAEALKTMIKGPEPLELAIVGGLGLWRVSTKVRGLLQRREGTHQYLTDILRAQHPVLQLMYPLGLQQAS
jgi:hypothetical protein